MNSLYDLTVRMRADVAGFVPAIAMAIRQFQNLRSEAGRTQSAVESALQQRTNSYTAVQRATTNLDSAQRRYNGALQDHLRISGQYGASSTQAARSLDRLAIAHNGLAQAQLSQATAANRAANATATYSTASAAALAAQAREDRANRGFNQLAVGGLETGVGLGILGLLKGSIQNALRQDVVQTTIGQALTDASGRRLTTAARAATLAQLSGQEITLGLRNQMSQTDVANIALSAVRSGMTTGSTLQRILPGLTNFAEVLNMTRGYSPTQSASTAAQFAHLFGAWKPSSFNAMTNLMGRALFVSPASPQEFLSLISQFSGTTRGLYGKGAANQSRALMDTVRTGLLLTEMGQETRGGTQLAQMVSRLLGTGSGRSLGALRQLGAASGVHFFNTAGQFTGLPDVVRAIFTAYQHENVRAFGRQMHDAFGQVGTRLAGNLAQLSTKDRLTVLNTMLGPNGLPQSSAIQQAINASPQSQINQFHKNLQTLSTVIGTQLLPNLAPFISGLTSGAKVLVEIAKANPDIVRLVGQVGVLSGGLLAVIGPLTAAAGVLNILSAGFSNVARITALLASGTGVGGALGGLILTVGATAVAFKSLIAIVQFISDHWPHGLNKSQVTTPATPGRPSPLLPPGAGPHTPIVLPGMGVPQHWVPGYGWRSAGWSPPILHAPQPPGHTRPGVGGGTRLQVNVGGIHLHGVDHADKASYLDEVQERVMAGITKALDFDENYEGLGIHSLAPGPAGY